MIIYLLFEPIIDAALRTAAEKTIHSPETCNLRMSTAANFMIHKFTRKNTSPITIRITAVTINKVIVPIAEAAWFKTFFAWGISPPHCYI